MRKPPQCTFFRLDIQTRVHRTESAVKLEDALRNIVRLVTTKVDRQNLLMGTSNQIESLSIIYEQVRARRSISVLRRMLLCNLEDDSTSFLLNKQAAAAGVVALIDRESESPLGGIRIHLQCQPIQQVIEWLTYASHLD